MTRAEIIAQVRIKMDELAPFDEGLLYKNPEVSYEKPVEEYIEELLDESTEDLLFLAPLSILTPKPIPDLTTTVDSEIGFVVLPPDFLRLYSFKMVGWHRTVTKAISPEHPVYNLQKNKFTRGGVNKPVVVVRTHPQEGKILEYYSDPSLTHTVEEGLYINRQLPEELDNTLIPPLSWLTASKLFQIFEMPKEAEAALNHFQFILSPRTR